MKSLKEKPKSISDIQSYLKQLYSSKNDARSIEYLYCYLFRNASYLSRVIGEKRDPKDNFIKTLSWLFAISNKLKVNLEDVFVRKYPNICPYCLVKPCICVKTGKKPVHYIPEWKAAEEVANFYNVAKSSVPSLGIDKAVTGINDLYPANKHIWNATGPAYQFYRILEELGEVHEAYSAFVRGDRKKEAIEDEIADIFAWLLSSWGIAHESISLQDAFISYYYKGCPVCHLNPCECADHSDRGERLVEISELISFKKKIEELCILLPEYNDKLSISVQSLNAVAESKSTVSAVRSVKQTTAVLEQVAATFKPIDSAAQSVNSLIKSIIAIAKGFSWMT